jgi:hypothetical protein
MRRTDYDRFTADLREGLQADDRVLGLVALGSMSGEPPLPDAWSDHDFFVICRPGEQERLRTDLSWLPDAPEIVLAFRETAHGLKVLYGSGHLLEFAVFDLEELALARINRYHTLLDRAGVEDHLRRLRERSAREVEERRPDTRWLAGQLVTALLVGAGRYLRGERLAGRAAVAGAAGHLVQLLARVLPSPGGVLDSLDPLRRFEKAHPALGAEIDDALRRDPPDGALRLLELAMRELSPRIPDFPTGAARAVAARLTRGE